MRSAAIRTGAGGLGVGVVALTDPDGTDVFAAGALSTATTV
jgi:hypothetical protein